MSNSLKIKNRFLVDLGAWFNEQKLSGAQSRARTKMVEFIVAGIEAYEAGRKEIIGEFVNKEEDGTWKKIAAVDNSPERWDIDAAKIPEVEKEYAALSEEDWILDVQESNTAVLKQARDILLNTDYLFGPREGEPREDTVMRVKTMGEYPAWCDAFEALVLD